MIDQLPDIVPGDFSTLCEVSVECDRKRKFVINSEAAQTIRPYLEDGKTEYSSLESDYKVILEPAEDGSIRGDIFPGSGRDCNCEAATLNCFRNDAAYLIIHFPDVLLKLKVGCPCHQENEEDAHTWLCLDLGNTRTCAQLDLPDEDIDFYHVRFGLHFPNTSAIPQQGTLESICGAVWEKTFDKAVSFMTFGKTDTELYRRLLQRNLPLNSRFLLSSPKRYFWDAERDDGWKKASASYAFTDFAIPPAGDLECAILQGCGKNDNHNISPQQLFVGAIVELLEQAEQTLEAMKDNPRLAGTLCSTSTRQEKTDADWEAFRRRSLDPAKGITDLVMTCPAAWSQHERRLYTKVIKDACRFYASNYGAGCRHLEFNLSCDEATAVLMYYIRHSITSCNPDHNRDQDQTVFSWLYKYGKIDSQGINTADGYIPIRVRIGVLDIGGGTSDLTIAELRSNIDKEIVDQDEVMETPSIKVETLYSDGTSHAGDEFLLVLTNKMLLDMVKRSLLTEDGWENLKESSEHMKQFDDFIRDTLTWKKDDSDDFNRTIRPLARSFWFELAIKALDVLKDASPDQKDLFISLEDDSASYVEGYRDFLEILQDKVDAFLEKTTDEWWQKEYFNFEINENNQKLFFPEDWHKLYLESLEMTFQQTAALLCSAVTAYDCDYLLFSGKTLENTRVQDYFKNSLPCRCEFPTNMNSKLATAIGAEYYTRRNEELLEYGIELKDGDNKNGGLFYWRVYNVDDSINRKKQICSNEPLKFLCHRSEVIIYKVKFPSDPDSAAIPCYKLKYKNGGVSTGDRFRMELAFENDELVLKRVTKAKTQEVQTDNWTLSVCMTLKGQQNWLDSGEILLDDQSGLS